MKTSKSFFKGLVLMLALFGYAHMASAQGVVKGVVTDTLGMPMAGVSVSIKNSSKGTNTDQMGNFTLSVAGKSTLFISYIGYEPQEANVIVGQSLTIRLRQAVAGSPEGVVVTALGIKRSEKSLGYATQKVAGSTLETVKGIDVATSMTGRVSGLVIKNSTEFFAKPTIELRGESALLVIDGVPYGNMTLRDIPSDDIESIDVLKGATASALYGSRASGGVLLVTTKKGNGKGLAVNINSNTMFQTGFLAIPKVQTKYGRGENGLLANDYVWGPLLDAGNTGRDWNPVTKQFEDNRPLQSVGGDNLKNFMETGVVTNNNISVSQSGQNGSFRASMNHIYNKGQFPNAKLNMFNFTLGGELKAGDKFTVESHVGISRRQAPQIWGSGYGNQGYIYQLTMWTGPEYDVRQYKDYWKVPNQTQNWLYTNWYDNPYFIAYQKLDGIEQNTINANLTANYKFTKDLNLLVRIGYDIYSNTETQTNPTANIYSTRGGWNARGLYAIYKDWGWSTNDDIILSYNKKAGKFSFDAMGGGTIYKWQDESLDATTKNGLTAPTYYSLNASVDPVSVTPYLGRRQINSLYERVAIGWHNAVFLDATGRTDWNSSQSKANRSYFYPSLGSSIVLSELVKLPKAIDMLKVRASWATFKTAGGIYENNRTYSTSLAWNNLNSASYPSSLLGDNLSASAFRTWEVGGAAYMFHKRLHVDVAYFNKFYYNQQVSVTIPNSSGFSSTLVNSKETYVRKGFELTIDGSIIKKKNFEWFSTINLSNQHRYYVDLDPVFSDQNDPWVGKGLRKDSYVSNFYVTDPQGNLVHDGGGYVMYSTDLGSGPENLKKFGYGDPTFSFGFINAFTVGNFQLGLNIDGRIGGVMYNYVYDKAWDSGTNPATDNQDRYDEVKNGKLYIGKGVKVVSGAVTYDSKGNVASDTRVFAPNDVPISYQAYAQWFRGGENIQSKTFVKVREISAGYRLPVKMLKKVGIKTASVSLTAQNAFMFTGFKFSDPDVDDENLNSPSQRIIGVNFKVGF